MLQLRRGKRRADKLITMSGSLWRQKPTCVIQTFTSRRPMAQPLKLGPYQRIDVVRRLAAGEGVRALAREFGVDPSMISRIGVSEQAQQIRAVAEQVARARSAIEALPVALQDRANRLAEQLVQASIITRASDRKAATTHLPSGPEHARGVSTAGGRSERIRADRVS
jgi:transposase-like protein